MHERIIGTKNVLLTDRILDLTREIHGKDFVNLVVTTGNTDRGVAVAIKKLIKDGRLHGSAGHYSSHPALTV